VLSDLQLGQEQQLREKTKQSGLTFEESEKKNTNRNNKQAKNYLKLRIFAYFTPVKVMPQTITLTTT
jgi:hypothetical protein